MFLHAVDLKSISSTKLHCDLKITRKSAWFMIRRIREAVESEFAVPWPGRRRADEALA